jgi:1-phosphatidylinositol-4-phosphate 5-kinase
MRSVVMPLILDWGDGSEKHFPAKQLVTMNGSNLANGSPKLSAHHLVPLETQFLNGSLTTSPGILSPQERSSSPTSYLPPTHTFTAPAPHIPKPIDTTLRIPQQPHRRSSPSRYSHPPIANTSVASFESITRPNAPPLQHRHTLEVPRPSTQLSRPSKDYPSRPSAESDIQHIAASPTSPTTPSRHRHSNTLTRRLTRSLHSDLHLDDAAPDEDASRFTDMVRNKRMSRRRRKEEEDDDRVLVGTRIDDKHANWIMAYNMLTGIRFTVSRTNAKRPPDILEPAHFSARHKFSFDV